VATFEHYLPKKRVKPAKTMLKTADILMKAHKNFIIRIVEEQWIPASMNGSKK